MDFWQFSQNTDIHIIPGKLSKPRLHAWWFSNPCGKLFFFLKVWDKSVPYFKKKKELSTWIGEEPCIQMDFRQFSRNNKYVSIPGKLSEIHLYAQLFSNSCGKVLIIVGIPWSQPFLKNTVYVALSDPDSMKFQQWLGPFHMDWRTTIHANGFLTIFQECRHMY